MSAEIVIAARGGPTAKSRCAAELPPVTRARLVEAMLADMLTALTDGGAAWTIHVVTPTQALAEIAVRHGAHVIAENSPCGLNAALDLARDRLAGEGPIMFLPGDLALLQARDVGDAFAAWAPGRAVLAPSRDGGTGAIVVGRAARFAFDFGGASLQRHLASAEAGRLLPQVIDGGSLALDLDRAEDAARVLALRPHGLTAGVLRSAEIIAEAAA